jgi:thiol-disulfide isomerase/thioredoxin
MKHIIGLLAMLLPILSAAQTDSLVKPVFKTPPEYDEGRPLYIQGNLPDIFLGRIINYKDTSAWRSDFSNKIIIFDFWNSHCGTCVSHLPYNDSIQQLYGKYLQIIMVTKEPMQDVQKFIVNWQQKHQRRLSIPVVVEDAVVASYFWHVYMPNYSWILPSGKFMLQTSKIYINEDLIRQILYKKTKFNHQVKN